MGNLGVHERETRTLKPPGVGTVWAPQKRHRRLGDPLAACLCIGQHCRCLLTAISSGIHRLIIGTLPGSTNSACAKAHRVFPAVLVPTLEMSVNSQ